MGILTYKTLYFEYLSLFMNFLNYVRNIIKIGLMFWVSKANMRSKGNIFYCSYYNCGCYFCNINIKI